MRDCNSIECNSIETTYYQRNRDMILNTAKNYYKNDKERLRDNARDKYRNLPEEEENKKIEYRRNIYYNMSEEKTQKLKEYQRNYCEANEVKRLDFYGFTNYAMLLTYALIMHCEIHNIHVF